MPFFAKADMDKVCYIGVEIGKMNDSFWVQKTINQKKCQRNNILTVWALPKAEATAVIDKFCRYDREVNYIYFDEEDSGRLTCVLYSQYPRALIN